MAAIEKTGWRLLTTPGPLLRISGIIPVVQGVSFGS
jgi:hypothetical protein